MTVCQGDCRRVSAAISQCWPANPCIAAAPRPGLTDSYGWRLDDETSESPCGGPRPAFIPEVAHQERQRERIGEADVAELEGGYREPAADGGRGSHAESGREGCPGWSSVDRWGDGAPILLGGVPACLSC